MRTRVYADGMNLYYGALKRSKRIRYKWLNLVELAHQLLPQGHIVEKLRYFTRVYIKICQRNMMVG